MTDVKAVMSDHAPVCFSASDWAQAARALWETDAGVAVVLDAEQHPLGIVTERDICQTVAMRENLPETLTTADIMTEPAPCCRPDDDVTSALGTMALHHLPALPVIGADGDIVGIVSVQKILLGAGEDHAVAPAQIVQILRDAWSRRQLPENAMVCGWEHR